VTVLRFGSALQGQPQGVLRRAPRSASQRGIALAVLGLVGLLSVSTIVGKASRSYGQDVVVINGRGFGHGVGLAQDGAYWMGRAGRSATEILRLFFPGTVIAKRGGTVRVPLGGGGSAQLGFPNGGTIGELRVPAGGSVSVRASGGEVVASVLTGSSSAGEVESVPGPTTPTGQSTLTGQSARPGNSSTTPEVTPSGIGVATVTRGEPANRADSFASSSLSQDRSMFVAFGPIHSKPALRDSSPANGDGLLEGEPASTTQNEIVNALERFQADSPIVSSVVTVPASSATTPTPSTPLTPSSVSAPTNPPVVTAVSVEAPINPVPVNPVPTIPAATAPNVGAAGVTNGATSGPDGAVPIATSVESSGTPGSGSGDPTDPEATSASNKPRTGTTQGSSLSAFSGGATIAFNGRRYRGSIEFTAGGGSLRITNSVDLEDYLKGMGEILTPTWPSAALQSQAIAARTYALRTMAIDGQVCPTQRCQVYLGAQAEYGKMNSAVDATRGKVLTYGGKLAATFYSASGGGTIATPEEGFGGGSSQQPYLKAGSYPTGDVLAWTVRMPLSEVARRVGYGGSPRGVSVTRVGASGRAMEVTVDGSSGPLRVGGPKFDAALGLKSTFFTINEPVFGSSGSGSGAGVGGLGSGTGSSSGSSSDLTSALAALGLSNASVGSGFEEQSRLLAVADPDFAAGSATTLPTNLPTDPYGSFGGPSSPDVSSSGFGGTPGSDSGSSVALSADTSSAPTTKASSPKPTQPDNSAGSTIEAINLPARDSGSSGNSDVVFLAVPTALLGFVGIGLRRRIKANKSANPSASRRAAERPTHRASRRSTSSRSDSSRSSSGAGSRPVSRSAQGDGTRRPPRPARPARPGQPARPSARTIPPEGNDQTAGPRRRPMTTGPRAAAGLPDGLGLRGTERSQAPTNPGDEVEQTER
jgi:SpoIID/LytB domain protein